jgi:hypothetical protein
MPEYLNEDYATIAGDLVFPNVQSCCAMVVTTTQNNSLGGFHLTIGTKRDAFDRVLSQLKTMMVGTVDGVYLVGNVLGRGNNVTSGLTYPGPLKAAIAAGLAYGFGVKYHDIGNNNPGVAVHAWRDPGRNTLQLTISNQGSWAVAGLVQPAPGMVKVVGQDDLLPRTGGPTYSQVSLLRPPAGGVRSCTLNANTPLSPFTMLTF